MSHPLAARLAAEAVGTALLVGIGTGAILATVQVGSDRPAILAVAWFFAVTIPVLLFAGISGAHLNPVVTVSLALDRRIPAREVPPHLVAQVAGAFGGSAVVELLLGTGSHLGATLPTNIGEIGLFGDEFAFTFLLVVSVLELVRGGVGRGRWRLLWPGSVVAVSTYLIGPFTGSSLNPARSLAPAVLSGAYTDLWVYFLATTVGGLAAVTAVRTLERLRRGRPEGPRADASS